MKDFDKLLTAFIEVANRNIASLEERNIASLEEKNNDLSKSVTTLLEENIELRNELKQINKRLQLAEGMIIQFRTKVAMQDEKIIDLTARSMRDNIVVNGIQENARETWNDTKKALENFFSKEMNVQNTNEILID